MKGILKYMNMYRKRIENCDAHFTTQTWQKWFVTMLEKVNGEYEMEPIEIDEKTCKKA